MSERISDKGIRTKAVHAGERPDPVTRAMAPNLVMSTTYTADPDATFSAEGFEEEAPYFYSRWSNPTVTQLEKKLAVLEEAESCIAFGSGMAAITALFLHQLDSGDELVISDVAYAGAVELARDLLPRLGVEVIGVNTSDLDEVEKAISPRTKLVYIETPCNPIVRLTDIAAVAGLAGSVGARLVVDSTFATPVATRPIAHGADYVIHSLTKYLSGHGDALGGALLGPTDEMMALRQRLVTRTGGIISPFNAWLTMRGIATLPLRMEAHQAAAAKVARFLEGHPKVLKVSYPGLPSHPQHALARKQMDNFSGMLAFQVADGRRAARQFSERLKIWHYAVSLGHHRSLIFYLPTHDMLANSFKLDGRQEAAYRDYAGEGIFRVSVGIEDGEDLCEDLDQALAGL
jgi:cystathionine beta-lyase/cystathionine gamma-synthase